MSVSVREAQPGDGPAIIDMATRFMAQLPYGDAAEAPEDVKRARMAARLAQVTANGVLLVGEDLQGLTGMLGFVDMVHPLAGGQMAFEVCWWVEERARGGSTAHRLIHAGLAAAKARGAVRMQFGSPNDEVSRMYRKLGFVRVEEEFITELV
jgi:ribosomal protein S18 acetylase RimI-like enzyme